MQNVGIFRVVLSATITLSRFCVIFIELTGSAAERCTAAYEFENVVETAKFLGPIFFVVLVPSTMFALFPFSLTLPRRNSDQGSLLKQVLLRPPQYDTRTHWPDMHSPTCTLHIPTGIFQSICV